MKSDSKPPSRVKIASFPINYLSKEMNHIGMKGDLNGITYLEGKDRSLKSINVF